MLEEVAAAAQGQEASLASRLAEAEGRAEAADAALAASLQKQTVRRHHEMMSPDPTIILGPRIRSDGCRLSVWRDMLFA